MKHRVKTGNLADIIADYIKKAAGNVRLTEGALLTKLDGLFASVNIEYLRPVQCSAGGLLENWRIDS